MADVGIPPIRSFELWSECGRHGTFVVSLDAWEAPTPPLTLICHAPDPWSRWDPEIFTWICGRGFQVKAIVETTAVWSR